MCVKTNFFFHSWWAFCLLFSHKKLGMRLEVNEKLVVKPKFIECNQPSRVAEKLEGRDVSFVDMTVGEDLTH